MQRTFGAIFRLATLFARCGTKTRIQQHDWSKLVGEKSRREQVGIVPTFFSVRANKFAKWKTDFRDNEASSVFFATISMALSLCVVPPSNP